MAGAHTKFTLENLAMVPALRKAMKAVDEMDGFMKHIGEEFAGAGGVISTRFQTETGPDGEAWAPLADRTVRQRERKFPGAPMTILRASGVLAGAINYQAAGGQLRIGTASQVEAYAAIHQFGGEAGRNLAAEIPARPYLGFSDDDLEMVEEEALDYFLPKL